MNGNKRETVITDMAGYMETGTASPGAELALDFCGYEYCRPGHSFGPFTRSPEIIHAVISGKGILRCQGKEYLIKENDIFLLPSGVECLYWADREEPWFYTWIAFHGTLSRDIIRQIGLSKTHPVRSVDDAEPIFHYIKNTMKYDGLTLKDRMMRQALLNTTLCYMIENSTGEYNDSISEPFGISYGEYAERYFRMNFMHKLRIADIAKKIGISQSYLVKQMKEHTGVSPQEYLIKLRMEHALHLLNHTSDPIGEVAQNCGYEDPLAFSKFFRAYFGMSPSECRKKYRHTGISEDEILY